MLLRIGLVLFPLGVLASIFTAAMLWDNGSHKSVPGMVGFAILSAVMTKRTLDEWRAREAAQSRKLP